MVFSATLQLKSLNYWLQVNLAHASAPLPQKNGRAVPSNFSAVVYSSLQGMPTYFFLAVAVFLAAGFAAGLAAPVFALVDLAAAG